MLTAQLICVGACRQVDIVRAFGVSKNSVIRSVNKYRAGGVKAFDTPRATRGATVMTPEVTAQAEQLLGVGWSRREVAEHLGLQLDTLRKAFQQGRLTEPGPLEPGATAPEKAAALQPPMATDRSTRAVEDAAAEMGTACTRPDQRVLAAFGLLDGAPTWVDEKLVLTGRTLLPGFVDEMGGWGRSRHQPASPQGFGLGAVPSRHRPQPPGATKRTWGDPSFSLCQFQVFISPAPTPFEPCRDVSFGGVLCALPALAENGLFRHVHDCLVQLRGYYSTLHVIVLWAPWRCAASRLSSSCSTNPPVSWASCWGWTAFPKSVVCGASWPP